MRVYERQPYSGQLVFAAFSGSHQDAIAKGMHYREEKGDGKWTVPYLPLDPTDVGRVYEADVIRINSQSGRGGISYVLETKYSLHLPVKMREEVGYLIKGVSDRKHAELQPKEIHQIFTETYVNRDGRLQIPEVHYEQKKGEGIIATVTMVYDGKEQIVKGSGNGRLDAVSNAIKQVVGDTYTLKNYEEHAIESKTDAKAAAYVRIKTPDKKNSWGVGIDNDIIVASVKALTSAINRAGL